MAFLKKKIMEKVANGFLPRGRRQDEILNNEQKWIKLIVILVHVNFFVWFLTASYAG